MGFTARSILDEIDQVRRGFMFMNSLLGTIGGVSLFVAAMMIVNALVIVVSCSCATALPGSVSRDNWQDRGDRQHQEDLSRHPPDGTAAPPGRADRYTDCLVLVQLEMRRNHFLERRQAQLDLRQARGSEPQEDSYRAEYRN